MAEKSRTATKATGAKPRPRGAGKNGATAATMVKKKPGRSQLFQPVVAPTRVDYPLLEEEIQRWWDEHDILTKYLHRNDAASKRFSFIDGPITANNPMGVHHAWGRTYKDLYQRYQDHAWLPASATRTASTARVCGSRSRSKKSSASTPNATSSTTALPSSWRAARSACCHYSRDPAPSNPSDWASGWTGPIRTTRCRMRTTTRSGACSRLCCRGGWLYRGHDVMPWCPRCATGISDMEINEGDRKVSTPASTCASRCSTGPTNTCWSGPPRPGRCQPTSPPR